MTTQQPTQQSLTGRSLKAAAWSVLGRGGSEALKLVSSLILTRLLFPEAFGLMATGISIMIMVQLFTDTGTRLSIIQNPRGREPEFLDTAWMIAVMRGIGLGIILALMAWPMGRFFGKAELTPLIMLLAITPVLAGCENPGMALVIRDMKGQRQVFYDLIPQIGGFICTVSLAFITRSVWSLAIGAVCVSALKLAASYLVDSYRPHLRWNSEAGREMIRFGTFIILNSLISWSATNLDRFFIGKMINMETLGIFSIGLNIGAALETFCIQILGNSFFPAISTVAGDLKRSVRVFSKASSTIMALAAPLLVTLALFSNEVMSMLYDTRYAGSGAVLFWISLRGMPHIISIIECSTLFAFGLPRLETIAMGARLVALVVLLPLGIMHSGIKGALLVLLAISLIPPVIEAIGLKRALGFPVLPLVIPWLQAVIVSGVAFAAHALLRPYLGGARWQSLPHLAATLAIAASVSLLMWRLAMKNVDVAYSHIQGAEQ